MYIFKTNSPRRSKQDRKRCNRKKAQHAARNRNRRGRLTPA